MANYKVMTFRMSHEMAEKALYCAKSEDQNLAQVVRRLLKEYIQQKEKEHKKEVKQLELMG